jgi:hypothetical protein
MLPDPIVDAFVADHPDAHIVTIPGANHYTMVFGAGPGPQRVTATIEAAIRGSIGAMPQV